MYTLLIITIASFWHVRASYQTPELILSHAKTDIHLRLATALIKSLNSAPSQYYLDSYPYRGNYGINTFFLPHNFSTAKSPTASMKPD